MTSIHGKVSDKQIKSGFKGDDKWTLVTYTIDGEKYSSFNRQHFDAEKEDIVNLDFEKKGEYNNITSIEVMAKAEKPFGKFEKMAQVNQEVWDKKDLRMVKMNALTQANTILTNLITLDKDEAKKKIGEKYLDLLLSMAEACVEWVYTV